MLQRVGGERLACAAGGSAWCCGTLGEVFSSLYSRIPLEAAESTFNQVNMYPGMQDHTKMNGSALCAHNKCIYSLVPIRVVMI